MTKKHPYLIFIDTNIILDFYRVSGSFGDELLQHVNENHSSIITSDQIQMEYKKNRQKVILDSLSQLKPPNWDGIKIPAFLHDAQATTVIKKNKNEIIKRISTLRKTIDRVLTHPEYHDPIYKTFQRLFSAKTSLNLTRENDLRREIRERAKKRFMLGYPPRKNSDLTIGDAVNWEWVIECAKNYKKNVIVVSRDSDYGVIEKGKQYINDWLKQEFKDRVSKKGKVQLSTNLSEALSISNISVRKETAEEEKAFIASNSNLLDNEVIENKFLNENIFKAIADELLKTLVDKSDSEKNIKNF